MTAVSFVSLPLTAQPTKIIIYEPYSQAGVLNPNIIVAQHYIGDCLAQSLNNPGRSDARRCISSSLILDPCFQDAATFACVISPWSHKTAIVELKEGTLSTKQPRIVNTQTAPPWALDLESGQRCTYLTGTTSAIEQVRVNYTCENSSYSVIGNINKSSPVWKAKIYDFNSQTIKEVPIVNAYY